jgi:hypothetical protein
VCVSTAHEVADRLGRGGVEMRSDEAEAEIVAPYAPHPLVREKEHLLADYL